MRRYSGNECLSAPDQARLFLNPAALFILEDIPGSLVVCPGSQARVVISLVRAVPESGDLRFAQAGRLTAVDGRAYPAGRMFGVPDTNDAAELTLAAIVGDVNASA
jgi:hypothetical protein